MSDFITIVLSFNSCTYVAAKFYHDVVISINLMCYFVWSVLQSESVINAAQDSQVILLDY